MSTRPPQRKTYRILMVTGIYPTEQRPHSGTFIKSQVDSLIEAGLEVDILHPKPGPTPLRYIRAALQVFCKTLTGRYDIVHGHYGLWILAARMQWTTPVVGSFLGDDLLGTPTAADRFSKKSLLVVAISRWLCKLMQGIIVKSEEMREATHSKEVFVIPNGVDFDLFCPRSRAEARTMLGWHAERTYVLFANDPAIPRKNFVLAQAAIECLKERGIDAELVVANGLPQSQVVQYINACNVLILPSLIEGSPNIVKETMACNVPVVATNVGDVAEVLGHTRGCSVCPFDPEALASGLEEAILHSEPTTGRADIAHLDRKVVAQQVIAVYKQALQGSQTSSGNTRLAQQTDHVKGVRARTSHRPYVTAQTPGEHTVHSRGDGLSSPCPRPTRSRNVLMLVENLPVPADRRVWSEATALRDAGFKVSIICPKGTTSYREGHTCIEGIHIYRYRLPTSANKYIAYLLEYGVALFMTFFLSLKVLLLHGFDALHAANPPDIFFLIGLFYRMFGKKFIFDQHDLAPEMFEVKFHGHMKFIYRLLLFCEQCSYQLADAVVVTNLSQKWNATSRGRCSPDKVTVVRNGPDLKRLKLVPAEMELKRGRRYLLAYIGVMGVQDGVEYALQALHELIYTRGRQDVSLVLMGDGDHACHLHALTHQLQLDSYVNFTGWTESQDIVRYLSTADVGLCPDPKNGLNEHSTMIKTMEYMAMGRPIVAFDLAETRFSAQEAALYATPNLVTDFADKIEMLLDNEQLRSTLGVLGRKRIEEELLWDVCKEQLLLMYQRIFPRSNVSRGDEVESIVEGVSVHR